MENTFAARIGQICNAALDRSVIAYNDHADPEERKRCRRDLESLAIYSGLEIDAAKTGVRPNLDEFLGGRKVKRTPFLQYKYLVERAEERRRAWYEPTHRERLEAFFAGIDWNQVDSPVERLPWLARQLERNTPKVQEKPAKDSELFIFAQERSWKKHLDQNILSSVSALLWDYEHCLSRIRACRAPLPRGQQRKTDIDRILYARGQEEVYDSDELYAFFQQLSSESISTLRKAIVEQQWHLMAEGQRETFLREHLPEAACYYDLLTDFRHGGFRMLGDLVCDIDDLSLPGAEAAPPPGRFPGLPEDDGDLSGCPFSGNERAVVSKVCRKLLNKIVRPSLAVPYVVALGKRNLLWDLLPDHIEEHVLEVDHAE